jgi:hypothetical protein
MCRQCRIQAVGHEYEIQEDLQQVPYAFAAMSVAGEEEEEEMIVPAAFAAMAISGGASSSSSGIQPPSAQS